METPAWVSIYFSPLEVYVDWYILSEGSYNHVWFSILEIQLGRFQGALAHVEYDMGLWKVDFLYLRQLYFWLFRR